MWKICWHYKPTGKSGCGSPISRELAEAWVAQLKNDPDFEYWILPALAE